jgi:hypothetical protein
LTLPESALALAALIALCQGDGEALGLLQAREAAASAERVRQRMTD